MTGVDRSELLPNALRRHLAELAADHMLQPTRNGRSAPKRRRCPPSPNGGRPKSGATGPRQRGGLWFAATRGGEQPVLVLTRDPVADRIGAVVVAAPTRSPRGLVSELEVTADRVHVPSDYVFNFVNIHTLPRNAFRRKSTRLSPTRLHDACRTLRAITGCSRLFRPTQ